MDGTTARDDKQLLLDLLKQLRGVGAVHPDDIPVQKIVGWFPYKTERPPQELVDILATDAEAPVEYNTPENSRVWLISDSEAADYIEQLEETPWHELNVDSEGPVVPDLDRV